MIPKLFAIHSESANFPNVYQAGSDEDAYSTANELAKVEGIIAGATSGANVWTAIQRAKKIGAGKKYVTVVCDSGLKYLQGDLFEK